MAQPPSEQKLSLRRNWILGGYTAELTYSLTLTPSQLSDVVDTCLAALHKHASSSSALDFKGRNHFDSIIAGIPGEADGEIFRLGGLIATGSSATDFEWSPFEASYHSEFKEFEGNHHITHTLVHHRSDAVPEWLPWRLLGAAAPIRPRYLRIGIERFQSRFHTLSFGYLPQVTDSLLIDALESKLSLRFVTERRKWQATQPFAEFPLFAAIAEALQLSLGLSIDSLFRTELAKATGR